MTNEQVRLTTGQDGEVMRTYQWFSAALLATALVGAAGCGSRSDHHLSGKVTFGGQPVPVGRIFFDADASKQNTGASGFANIEEGEYDTAKGGKGVAGGPTVVRIQGFHKEGADASGFGPPLFQEYSTQVDLPQEYSTKDFEVPASAARGVPKIAVPLDGGPVTGR